LRSGATLRFNEVGSSSFGALVIDGTDWSFEVGSKILVRLTSQLTQAAVSIPLMYYMQLNTNTNTGCNIGASISTVPSLNPRTVNSHCTTVTLTLPGNVAAATYNVLWLDIGPAVPTIVNEEVVTQQFNSSSSYQLTLNKDCALYGASEFVNDIVSTTLTGRSTPTTRGQISVISTRCGSVVVAFQCLSSISPEDAANLCLTIISEATTPGTPLHAKLQGTSGGVFVRQNDDSNNALYALFALLAIPVICLIAICLVAKAKRREADNQYMQDTATFSNVAATPQPLGAPGYYQPSSVVVEQQYMHKPY